MRRMILLGLAALSLAACAEPSPWADWESDTTSKGAATMAPEPGYKDYTPRAAIETAPLGGAPMAAPPASPAYGASPYDTGAAMPAAPAGAPTPLHAGPFAVASTPVAYAGKPIAQRTLPLALTGTGTAR